MSGTVGCTSQSMAWNFILRAIVSATPDKKSPGSEPGRGSNRSKLRLQPIEDLVGPEPLEAVQRLVQRGELVGIDAADLLDRAHVLLVERIDDVADLAAFVGELDAHRAAIDPRALMIE